MTQLDKLKNEVFLYSFEGNPAYLDNINKLPELNINWTKVAENLNTTFSLQDILVEVFRQYLTNKEIYIDYVDIERKEVTILDIFTLEELQCCKNQLAEIGWFVDDYDYILKELEEEEQERKKELQEKESKREEYIEILKNAPIEQLEKFVKDVY